MLSALFNLQKHKKGFDSSANALIEFRFMENFGELHTVLFSLVISTMRLCLSSFSISSKNKQIDISVLKMFGNGLRSMAIAHLYNVSFVITLA